MYSKYFGQALFHCYYSDFLSLGFLNIRLLTSTNPMVSSTLEIQWLLSIQFSTKKFVKRKSSRFGFQVTHSNLRKSFGDHFVKEFESNALSICTWWFEISSSQTWFSNLIFELDFWTWFFAGYAGSKNQVWKRQKIKLKNQVRELDISKIKYR